MKTNKQCGEVIPFSSNRAKQGIAKYDGIKRWAVAAMLTLTLHYAWEMGQAPLFTNFANAGWSDHAIPCFRAALGDLLIAFCAYALAALVFWQPMWPFIARWHRPFAVCLGVGLTITIAFEYYALRTNRWDYTDGMPTVIGAGLSPLAQWLAVPAITIVILQWWQKMRSKSRDRNY